MLIVCMISLVMLAIVSAKCLAYYSMTRGLLYYLSTEYNDDLSAEKAKGIRDNAMERIIRDAVKGH